MASAYGPLSEESLRCAVCLDVFTDPTSAPCGHTYCRACITHYWDGEDVCRCPLCKKTFHVRPEVCVNTCISEMVHRFRSLKRKEEYEEKTEADIQQMIQERQVKIEEVKRCGELSREDADTAIAGSVQVFTALMSCVERSQAEFIDVIEKKQKATEEQAEGFIEDLQQEITQLKERISELRRLSNAEDHHLRLIHNVPSFTTGWIPTKDWSKVNARQSSHVGTLRTAVAQLEKTLEMKKQQKQLCDAELRRIQRYAVDVTLDPDTANPWLILSDDGKQVYEGDAKNDFPDNNQRFSMCACILGKQNFSSGRFYYEVQVGGKTEWALGVARESINRKGQIKLTPNDGYWTIWLKNGNEYRALTDPWVLLPVREKVQKVGVFVDYEEGLVSFYDVETRVHLYSFTGCSFTEKLYPYFGFDHGANSVPLIISPVNIDADLGRDHLRVCG